MALGSPKSGVGDKSFHVSSQFGEAPHEQDGGTGRSGARKEGELFPGCLRYQVSLHGHGLCMVLLLAFEEPCSTGCRIVHPRERRWDIYPAFPTPAGQGSPCGVFISSLLQVCSLWSVPVSQEGRPRAGDISTQLE